MKRKGYTLFFFLAIYLIFASFITQTKILTNIDDLIDEDFYTFEALQSLKNNFIINNNISLFITSNNKDFKKSDLCQVYGTLKDIKMNFSGLDYIISSFSVKRLKIENDRRLSFTRFLDIDCFSERDYSVKPLLERIQKESPWKQIVSNSQANDIVIEFYFSKSENKNEGELDISNVSRLKGIWSDFDSKNENLNLHWIGDGIFQYYLRLGYNKTIFLNIIVILLVIVLFRLFFGTFKSSLIYVISIAITTTIVMGGMALAGSPVDVISNSISLMLFVSSIEDFVFVSHLKAQGLSTRSAFQKLLIASFLTSLTTFLGFGSLMFTDLAIIQRFGFWAATAAIVEWIVLFYFTPCLVAYFPKLDSWVNREASSSKLLSRLNSFYLPKALALMLLCTVPIALWGFQKIKVSDSPQAIFPQSHPGQKDLKYVEDSRGWKAHISLLFSDFESKKHNLKILDSFKDQDVVTVVENPYLIEDYLTQDLKHTGASDFVLEAWRDSIYGKKYYNLNNKNNEEELRAILYLKDLNINDVKPLIKRAKDSCPEGSCSLAGSLVSYAEFGARVLTSLFKSFMTSLALILTVILLIAFKFKTKHKVYLLLSSLWGPLTLLSVFYIFGITITYVTSLMASILLGLAGDNAIQFIYRKKDLEEDTLYYQNSSLFITVCMIFISLMFLLSDFVQIQKLGVIMAAGFVLNYIGDVYLLKSLIKKK